MKVRWDALVLRWSVPLGSPTKGRLALKRVRIFRPEYDPARVMQDWQFGLRLYRAGAQNSDAAGPFSTTIRGLVSTRAAAVSAPILAAMKSRAAESRGGRCLMSCASVATICTSFFCSNHTAMSLARRTQSPVSELAVI